MATKDVMLDIETLSTSGDALVLSIGAIQFDCSGSLGPTFGVHFLATPEVKEQILLGRRIDRETQLWWKAQPEAAQEHWMYPAKLTSLSPTLGDLNQFLHDADRIWAHGPQFDIAILSSLFDAINMKPAWNYRAIRDCRTFLDTNGRVRTYVPPDAPDVKPYPAHHPLADCQNQIIALWEHGLGYEAPVTAPMNPPTR